MKVCPICNRDITEEKKYLFFGENDHFWLICKPCERKLYLVTNGCRKRWVHLAIADLREKMTNSEDPQLKACLHDLITHRERSVGMHVPHV